jgi:hypothetical protein
VISAPEAIAADSTAMVSTCRFAVEHRVIDWAARSSFAKEFEVLIMIKVVNEEMHGSDRVLT